MKTRRWLSGGTILGILIGLVLGVLMSFGVVWYLKKSELPFRDKGTRAERPANGDQGGGPAPLPGKPGDKVGDKPRFEFYKILPGSQEASPAAKSEGGKPARTEGRTEGKTETRAEAKAETKPAEAHYLQVGSFPKAADADNLKARLALMGVEASVLEVAVPDKGKMFRVRTGPFSSVEQLNRARKELSDNGIQAVQAKGN